MYQVPNGRAIRCILTRMIANYNEFVSFPSHPTSSPTAVAISSFWFQLYAFSTAQSLLYPHWEIFGLWIQLICISPIHCQDHSTLWGSETIKGRASTPLKRLHLAFRQNVRKVSYYSPFNRGPLRKPSFDPTNLFHMRLMSAQSAALQQILPISAGWVWEWIQ